MSFKVAFVYVKILVVITDGFPQLKHYNQNSLLNHPRDQLGLLINSMFSIYYYQPCYSWQLDSSSPHQLYLDMQIKSLHWHPTRVCPPKGFYENYMVLNTLSKLHNFLGSFKNIFVLVICVCLNCKKYKMYASIYISSRTLQSQQQKSKLRQAQ